MSFSIIGRRLLILIVVASFSSLLWANCCTEPEDPSPDSQNKDNDCPPMPTLECCATIQPFVTVANPVVPGPEFSGAQLAIRQPTLTGILALHSIGPFNAPPPPGMVPSAYRATAVLRI
jgi:hypothetical protein